jgi:hypothetical protein
LRVNAQSSERVRELFAGALEVEAAQRERYLERECHDPAVRTEVLSLLDEPVRTEFLGSPLVSADLLERLEAESSAAPPERLGPYRVLHALGEGSAGAVYLAEQDGPVRRTVALKLLHPGANTRRMMARFRAEGRALAAMDHPHIARLFDVQTTEDGRLYFVMEHVRGEPITRFCAERSLGTRERLALLSMACAAVQHAHGKGVIHRDLKPSNILAFEGAEGLTLKVIDFGVAKIAAPDHESSSATEQGAILGTLAYMSPEQIDGRADARSDAYSLGALAYEVLTGRLPIEVRSSPLSEVIRRIREEQPVPAGRLDRSLRGDAETILAKALAKDPERRYASADAVGSDLLRLARGEPVLARGSSAPYLLATLARRHKRTAGAALGGLVVLIGALSAATAGFVRAGVAGREAALAEHRTVETLAFTARHALAELDGTTPTRAVRTAIAARLDADTAELLRRRPGDAALLDLRAEVLKERSRLLLDSGNATGSLALRRQAAEYRSQALALRPHDPDIASSYSIDLVLVGDALGQLGDRTGQRGLYGRAAEMHGELAARYARPIDLSRLSWSYLRLAGLDTIEGRHDSAIPRAQACLRLTGRASQSDPTDMSALDCALQAHGLLGGILELRGDHAAARRHLAARQEIASRLIRVDPSNRLYVHSYLRALLATSLASDPATAAILCRDGYDRASRMLVIDAEDGETLGLGARFAVRLAASDAAAGDAAGARAMLKTTLELLERLPGSGPEQTSLRDAIHREAAEVLTTIGNATGASSPLSPIGGSEPQLP